jgi:hypothetical protein
MLLLLVLHVEFTGDSPPVFLQQMGRSLFQMAAGEVVSLNDVLVAQRSSVDTNVLQGRYRPKRLCRSAAKCDYMELFDGRLGASGFTEVDLRSM